MRNSFIKIISVGTIGAIAIVFLIYFQKYTRSFFEQKSKFYQQINQLRQQELILNYEVLKTSFFLYEDYDKISSIQHNLESLSNKLFQILPPSNYPTIANIIEIYKIDLEKKLQQVERFKTLNASIKNSTIYLATLLQRIPSTISPIQRNLIIKIISDIFLIKNSLDQDFLHEIKLSIRKLQNHYITKQNFYNVFYTHVSIFTKTFPIYKKVLLQILQAKTLHHLNTIERYYKEKNSKELQKLTAIFIALIVFYILSIMVIILLISKLDKENRILKELQKELEIKALTDNLTKLYNRKAFKKDVRKLKNPFFAIININGFKHYNDFYGTATGDHILREVAKGLKIAIPQHYRAQFYRIGGDDFGILIEEEYPIDEKVFAQIIFDYFNKKKIVFKNVELYVSVSIGMSRKRPLLETADMTLKYVKNHKLSYLLYNDSLGLFKQIKENIKKSKVLKNAIDNQQILPHYQPMIDIKTAKIIKYEALARLKNDKGFYESIFPYLEIAKELRLYEEITKSVIQNSFEKAAKLKKSISINIAMKDIENPKMLTFFGQMFNKYSKIATFITFEILESETLKDYEAVKNFINVIRGIGCKVAIDDFGSGYSNFAHIFNLNIDYIKIDGSLIKNLDKDNSAKQIVAAIVFLAKKAKIKTIAEFVHSKEIFLSVKELGIDYAQGYYIAEPSPTL